MFQRLRRSQHLDCKSSQSSCKFGHHRRCFEPASWWILVGTSPMALSVGAIQHEEVVPGLDASPIHHLGEASNSSCCNLTLLRLLPVRVGRFLLAWSNPNAL